MCPFSRPQGNMNRIFHMFLLLVQNHIRLFAYRKAIHNGQWISQPVSSVPFIIKSISYTPYSSLWTSVVSEILRLVEKVMTSGLNNNGPWPSLLWFRKPVQADPDPFTVSLVASHSETPTWSDFTSQQRGRQVLEIMKYLSCCANIYSCNAHISLRRFLPKNSPQKAESNKTETRVGTFLLSSQSPISLHWRYLTAEYWGEYLHIREGNTKRTGRYTDSCFIGRAIAQPVSRWLPTEAARVRSRVWSSGICGGQSGAGAGFLRVLRFPLPIFIPTTAPQSPSPIIWGWYNRAEVAAVQGT
jgi:hypothetical protein